MKRLNIHIDSKGDLLLSTMEARFVFTTICKIIGVPWCFISESLAGESTPDIYYGMNREANARLIIPAARSAVHWSTVQFHSQYGLWLPGINGNSLSSEVQKNEKGSSIIMPVDIIHTIFCLLTGALEHGLKRNRLGIHKIQDFPLFRWDLMHIPIVDSYARFIKKTFQDSIQFLPKWPDNKRFAVVLSHDVDYPEMIRWIEAIRYTLRKRRISLNKIRELMLGKESFWCFSDWIELEKAHQLRSSFYFSAVEGNLFRYFLVAPDPFYDVMQPKYQSVAKLLEREGYEIGLHSSFMAYRSEEQFRTERNHLENAFNTNVSGNRHHYWHIDHERPFETALIHQNLGFSYDSSIVLEKHSGFRYGICSPFTLFHPVLQKELSVIQLPPSLMDDHLFGHSMHSKFADYKEQIDNLLAAVHEFEGLLVVDYHVRVFNHTFFPNWADSYRYLISRLSEYGNFFNATAVEIANYWKKRSELIQNQSIP